MSNGRFVSINQFVASYSEILDFIDPRIKSHHYDVAYIALEILRKLVFKKKELEDTVVAALLHDIGIFTYKERIDSLDFEFEEESKHSKRGSELLSVYKPFNHIAKIIEHHHDKWIETKESKDIPVGSRVIYLADRIAVLVDKRRPILTQVDDILEIIKKDRGIKFESTMVDAFEEIASYESFWMNLVSNEKIEIIRNNIDMTPKYMESSEILDLGKLFIQAIDFRSRFTAAHSVGVFSTAELMARKLGYSDQEVDMLKIAGYFHDIGKLAVPGEVLNKPGKLNKYERCVMKSHTYYTYKILKGIQGFSDIVRIASFHHEKLDGSGYPFHKKSAEMNRLEKTMAVADIFTALTEERPYRENLSKKKIKEIFDKMVTSNHIEKEIVINVMRDFDDYREHNLRKQKEAYENFNKVIRSGEL